MKSYQQYCSLARALEVIGDRWTLLIVRELTIRPCRYTDLRDGLPGIATNLLAERLRDLQAAGVVKAEHAPPPVATTLYSLTDWGEELRPVLVQIGRWGSRRLASGQQGDHFRSRWAALAVGAIYQDVDLEDLEPVSVLIDSGGEPALLTAGPDGVTATIATPGQAADVVLTTDPETTLALLGGRLAPDQLDRAQRRFIQGSEQALARLAELGRRRWRSSSNHTKTASA